MENKGKIKTLLTDQYSGINSTQFKQYVKSKGITLIFTAVDCAFSNGLNKRTNQTLVNRIRYKMYENKRPWTSIAEECVKEYNITIHSSTGFTLKYLLTGRDNAILPKELEKNKEENLEENRRSIAFENSKKIHEQNKKYYDQKVKEIEYKEGDLVYIQNGNELNRGKLEVIRSGPHKIKKNI